MEEDFYYDEKGNVIFTAAFLLKRGFCCGNGCINCPYGKEIQQAAMGKRKIDRYN